MRLRLSAWWPSLGGVSGRLWARSKRQQMGLGSELRRWQEAAVGWRQRLIILLERSGGEAGAQPAAASNPLLKQFLQSRWAGQMMGYLLTTKTNRSHVTGSSSSLLWVGGCTQQVLRNLKIGRPGCRTVDHPHGQAEVGSQKKSCPWIFHLCRWRKLAGERESAAGSG